MSSPYQPYPQDPPGGYGQPPYPPQGGCKDPSQRGYLQGGPVGFGEAISQGFKNIVTFKRPRVTICVLVVLPSAPSSSI